MKGHTFGFRSKNVKISLRSSIAKLHSVTAVASAVRSFPSSRAISPKSSPGVRIASASICPFAEATLIRTLPFTTAIIWSPGDPCRKMVSPAAKLRIRIRTRAKSAFLSSCPRLRKSQHAPSSRRASSTKLRSVSSSNFTSPQRAILLFGVAELVAAVGSRAHWLYTILAFEQCASNLTTSTCLQVSILNEKADCCPFRRSPRCANSVAIGGKPDSPPTAPDADCAA
jgi:hypothetical protein